MLPAAHRLTEAASFSEAVRRGRRASSETLVTHVLLGASSAPARVGFVVSKAVGNSVVRSRVQRRLRHAARTHLHELPAGCSVVVRALPASARASSAALGSDLARCLARAGIDVVSSSPTGAR